MPERLPGERVRQVHFNDRDRDCGNRVAQGDGRVGVAAGIEDDRPGAARRGLVQPVDQMAFMVGLAEVEGYAQLPGPIAHHPSDIVERVAPINLGFAGAEQVEVGAVEDKDGGGHLRWQSLLPISPPTRSCRAKSRGAGTDEKRTHLDFARDERILDTRTTLTVTVNGDPHRITSGATIAGMLRELGVDPVRVAVERNLAIVPKSTLENVLVEDDDRFEIVHFVGGG